MLETNDDNRIGGRLDLSSLLVLGVLLDTGTINGRKF
jgi:hypothetical protein